MKKSDINVKPAVKWEVLCRNADFFHLEKEKFFQLHDFYLRMDQNFFKTGAEKVFHDFPMQEAKKKLSESDLRKFLLLCLIANRDFLIEYYSREGLPEMMLQEISRDLRTWLDTLAKDFEGYGLTPRIFDWERSCLNGDVKSFGRLQANDIHFFQLDLSIYLTGKKLTAYPAFSPSNPPCPDLTRGDKTIAVHIPATGAMDETDCIRSIQQMWDFSRKFHPDYDCKAIVCYSWLLDPVFRQILKASSNIVKFQQLGHTLVIPGQDQTAEVKWRIWGAKYRDTSPKKLPARTSLERGVAEYLSGGGQFTEGLLVIFLDELPALFKRLKPASGLIRRQGE